MAIRPWSLPAGWPRSLIYGDQIGLSRLSGHSVWEGGLHVRRFELSSTTRNRLPVEYIELATALAEVLALDYDILLPPVTAAQVEAAYRRRMKAIQAELGPPQQRDLPACHRRQTSRRVPRQRHRRHHPARRRRFRLCYE